LIIHLETADQLIVDAVRQEILLKSPDATIHTDQGFVHQHYLPGSGEHILLTGPYPEKGKTSVSRWSDLHFASLGGRLWTEDSEPVLAAFAGKLSTGNTAEQIVVDAAYAEARAAFFQSFGVNYLGRTYQDPRTLIVVDNKLDNPDLRPTISEPIHNILASFPDSEKTEGSWVALGLVSVGSTKRLGKFLDYLSETNVLTSSKGTSSKLDKIGDRDYAQIPKPVHDAQFGLEIRNLASLLKPVVPGAPEDN
jgi:hypothetical protein